VRLNLPAGEQRKPEFLRLNPNGKVPTLVADGTPIFEGLAIISFLGERFGVARGVWPAADTPERLQAMSWSAWAYVTYGAALSRLNVASSPRVPAECHNAAQVEFVRRELKALMEILEERLADRDYLIGGAFSLVDLIVACMVVYGTYCGATIDAYPRIQAWTGRCMERPAFAKEWGAS
jgi:GST-like protein